MKAPDQPPWGTAWLDGSRTPGFCGSQRWPGAALGELQPAQQVLSLLLEVTYGRVTAADR